MEDQSIVQYSDEKSEPQDIDCIGRSETSYVAKELPAKVHIDSQTFTVDADSEDLSGSESNEYTDVNIEVPCKYCDTKLEFAYSGEVPSPVSGVCSHCGNSVTVFEHNYEGSLSINAVLEYVREYQSRRIAYVEGQQYDSVPTIKGVVDYARAISLLLFVWTSFIACFLLDVGYNTDSGEPAPILTLGLFMLSGCFILFTFYGGEITKKFTDLPHSIIDNPSLERDFIEGMKSE